MSDESASSVGKCKTCRFCISGEVDENLNRQNFCHRFPPMVHPIHMQNGVAMQTMFPPVTENSGCGEWRLKQD